MSIATNSYPSLPYGQIWITVERCGGCCPQRSHRHAEATRPPDRLRFIPSAIRRDRTMPRPTPPASHEDLLDRPLFAHLTTVRPDGAPQSGLMWFVWDGERARFSHTRTRQKARNLAHEPRVPFHLVDPDDPYRTLEVRGRDET